MRPENGTLVAVAIGLTIAQGATVAEATSMPCDADALVLRMVRAAEAGDWPRFAETLEGQEALRITSTIEAQLWSELLERPARSGETQDKAVMEVLRDLLFSSDLDDAFADVFAATGFAPWREDRPGRYVPDAPGYEDGRTFMDLVCTPAGSEIAEIGWPAS